MRELSRREMKYVDDVIDEICDCLKLDRNSEDVKSIGRTKFLEVYRKNRRQFMGTKKSGWNKAIKAMTDDLLVEKQAQDFIKYRPVSLDAPISEDIDVPRVNLLRSVQGDFQGSVAFWDCIERLTTRCPDAGSMAGRLAAGYTIEEIKSDFHWDDRRLDRALTETRSAMEEYLNI